MKRIVKIGGSVITNKNSSLEPKINFDVLSKLPDAIAYVFGVGSFGHTRALELGLTEDYSDLEIEDFQAELDTYYEQILACFKTSAPIYFGGIENKNGLWRIISGDEIVVKLAIENNCDEILYITETGGVEMNDDSLITEFEAEDVYSVIDAMKKHNYLDATGGMRGKLEKIADLGFRGRIKFSKL